MIIAELAYHVGVTNIAEKNIYIGPVITVIVAGNHV